MKQLKIPYKVIATCDCDKDAVLSYAAMRTDFENEFNSYDFPSVEDMISELQNKNVGFDFMKNKQTITTRTSIEKLKQYYLADKLSKNLGDIGKVERLPYADLVTYSFPCTDLSVAGKGEGMQNKCDSCGHSWPIDFSNAEEVLICPNCGEKVSSSTRSGLLGQVQRLLSVAYEKNELPKYLLLENVKNLVGKKFKSQFDAWVKWLDSIGYNTYYQVLNAKHYRIPQNRERIFALSIRKDIDSGEFKFPEKTPLNIRLKDMLEKNVDEKYYLPDDRIDKIVNSTFMQEKKQIQMKDVYDTLLARDWKDPKCVQVEEPFVVASRGRNPDNPSDRTTGAPTEQRLEPNFSGCTNTLTSVQKDNWVAEPIVCEERRDEGIRLFKDDCVGTLRTIDACGDKRVIEPEVNPRLVGGIGEKNFGKQYRQGNRVYDSNAIAMALNAQPVGNAGGYSYLYAVENEPEPQLEFVGGLGDKDWAKDGKKLSRNYPQGSRVYSSEGIASALTAQGVGGAGGYSGLYTVEEPEIIKEDIIFPVMVRKYDVDVENLKKVLREHKNYSNKEIAEKLNVTLTQAEHWFRQDEYFAIPDADIWFELKNLLNITTDEFDESITTFEVKDGVYDKSNRCYHVDGIAPTLTVTSGNEKIFEPNDIKWRIRKLTERECWRLMGFTDQDHNRAAKYTSASARYKQAGNSICTCCLIAIFNALFLEDYSTSYAEKLVDYNS